MLQLESRAQIWLYTEPTDMRKQFDGLAALAKNKLQGQFQQAQFFVFINRKRTQIKVLYYRDGGLCLWSKRLERGHFQQANERNPTQSKLPLSWAQLQCLIEGIEWQKTAKYLRYSR